MAAIDDEASEGETATSRVATLAILAVAFVLFMVLSLGVYQSAMRIDATSRAREERLVANGLKLHAERVRHSLTPNTIWDDAVLNLDTSFNPKWAQTFIGAYFWHTDGYQLVYVVDGAGRPVMAFERGKAAPNQSYSAIADSSAPLVREIRARERARRPARPKDGAAPEPIDASTVARRGGEVFILAASLVQSDHATGAVSSARAPIVVVGQAIDGAFIADMTRRYLLDALHTVPTGRSAPSGYDSLPVSDAAGATLVQLAWKPHSPTLRLMGLVGPPMALAFLALAGAAALLIRHERRRNRVLFNAMGQARLASEAKSVFLATMSHEIRTPLNGILGMVQAMSLDPAAAQHADRLAIMRQSGEALLTVLNDVLDLSKIEAGKLEVEDIAFNLEPVLREVHGAYAALAAHKGLTLELDIEGASGLYQGDPTRIRQILFNLASNAIKFTEAGEVSLRAERDGAWVRLSVADTGMGIAPEVQGAVFGKFSQADSSTTRRFGGSGLGLAISRELAELMGGEITLQSTPGEGSCFTLSLPLVRLGEPTVEAAPAAADRPIEAARTPLRILAAEDNAVNQLVLKVLLESFGHGVTMVSNGALAVDAWQSDHWDLVLMDVQMPVMDGVDATRAIRAREAARGVSRTPIFALTANAMAHQTGAYLEAGMDGQLDKPINAARLYAVVSAVEGARDETAPPIALAS